MQDSANRGYVPWWMDHLWSLLIPIACGLAGAGAGVLLFWLLTSLHVVPWNPQVAGGIAIVPIALGLFGGLRLFDWLNKRGNR